MNRLLFHIATRIIMPLGLIGVAFVAPPFGREFDISNLLTVVSILFAILVGFFFATATTNYIALKSLIAEEVAALIALFNIGVMIAPAARARLTDAIDHYTIAALDFPLESYADNTTGEFDEVIMAADAIQSAPDDIRGVELISHFHAIKTSLFRIRQSVMLTAPRIIRPLYWVVIIALGASLDTLLLASRQGADYFSDSVVGILIGASYFSLLILYEIDGNQFLEKELAYTDSQSIFRAVGREQYYPASAISKGAVILPSGVPYRIGKRVAAGGHEITRSGESLTG